MSPAVLIILQVVERLKSEDSIDNNCHRESSKMMFMACGIVKSQIDGDHQTSFSHGKHPVGSMN